MFAILQYLLPARIMQNISEKENSIAHKHSQVATLMNIQNFIKMCTSFHLIAAWYERNAPPICKTLSPLQSLLPSPKKILNFKKYIQKPASCRPVIGVSHVGTCLYTYSTEAAITMSSRWLLYNIDPCGSFSHRVIRSPASHRKRSTLGCAVNLS